MGKKEKIAGYYNKQERMVEKANVTLKDAKNGKQIKYQKGPRISIYG
jgi:hypothetical protein